MTPTFALDLSPDGVALLAKSGARWLRVGTADPAGDLEGGMTALREAAGRPGAPVPVRAVLPRDQLLYAVLENLPEADADRFRAIRRALDGRTPYPVEDLAFDWQDLDPQRAAVCAVACETLAEAEAFLGAHGFVPTAFVAAPRPAADATDAAEASFGVEPFLSPGPAAGSEAAPAVGRGGPSVRAAGDMPPALLAALTGASEEAGAVPKDVDGHAGPLAKGPTSGGPAPEPAASPATASGPHRAETSHAALEPLPGDDERQQGPTVEPEVDEGVAPEDPSPVRAQDGAKGDEVPGDVPVRDGGRAEVVAGAAAPDRERPAPADMPVFRSRAAALPEGSQRAGGPLEDRRPVAAFASRRSGPPTPRTGAEGDPHRRTEPRITFRPLPASGGIASAAAAVPSGALPAGAARTADDRRSPPEPAPGAAPATEAEPAFRRQPAAARKDGGRPAPAGATLRPPSVAPAPLAETAAARGDDADRQPDLAPAAAPFTRPRSRIDARASDRLRTMRGETRPQASPIETRSPDDIVAAFAGLKQPAVPGRRSVPLPFVGGMVAGLALVGALGGWLMFGPEGAGNVAAPQVAGAASSGTASVAAGTDRTEVAAVVPAAAPAMGEGRSIEAAAPAGEAFARVFRGGEVIPVEPVPEAEPATAAADPALPDPDAAAVRSAPRALAAPSARSGALPAPPDLPPGEEVRLRPGADAPAEPATRPASSEAAEIQPQKPEPAAGTLAGPEVAATVQDEATEIDISEVTPVAFRDFSAGRVQQAAPRRQAEPRPFPEGIVEVAAVPPSWDGPRGTGALAGPVRAVDPVPGVYLPPAPADRSGLAAARPRATEDGVEGLDGVLVYAGGPPRTPPVRPEAPPTVLGSFPDPSLAGYRPRLRSPGAAARWLETERAALAAAESLATEAADPASGVAEPTPAELAEEPVAAAPDAGADVIATAFDGLASGAAAGGEGAPDDPAAAPGPDVGAAAPDETAVASFDPAGTAGETMDAAAGNARGEAVELAVARAAGDAPEPGTGRLDDGAPAEPLTLASADVTAVDPGRPAVRPGAATDAAPDAAPGAADGDLRVEAQPARPSDPRPRLRPRTVGGTVSADAIADAIAAAEEFEVVSASAFAVPASRRPGSRTTDLTRKAAAILERRRAEATETVQVRSAPAAATPSVPTHASVARAATLENALALRKTALMGTYGTRSSRRALIRTASGRYVKVEVGDRVDGGRVQAIGNGVLVYVKGGRKVTLEVPGS